MSHLVQRTVINKYLTDKEDLVIDFPTLKTTPTYPKTPKTPFFHLNEINKWYIN
jgi:hypothetical protein